MDLETEVPKVPVWRRIVVRTVCFIVIWLALAGADIADLPAFFPAVAAATYVSLMLLPSGKTRRSAWGVIVLGLDFLWQSVVAGADVALRALSPRLRLRPGYITSAVNLPAGPARNAFCALMSLMPGSLPAWQHNDGTVTLHCLDVDQPVAAQMAAEEKLFARAFLGKGRP